MRANGSITFVSAGSARQAIQTAVGPAVVNGAIEAAILTLALELAPIRVNAVRPDLSSSRFRSWPCASVPPHRIANAHSKTSFAEKALPLPDDSLRVAWRVQTGQPCVSRSARRAHNGSAVEAVEIAFDNSLHAVDIAGFERRSNLCAKVGERCGRCVDIRGVAVREHAADRVV